MHPQDLFFWSTPKALLALMALLAVAGCDLRNAPGDQQSQEAGTPADSAAELATTRQTAFRVRADFDAGLNSDQGWAAGVNQAATVAADRPFRVRFEVEAAGYKTSPSHYRLQVRRNAGEWALLPAENFPQPAKIHRFALDPSAGGRFDQHWKLEQGELSAMRWQTDGSNGYLRVENDGRPLLALGHYRIPWQQREFGVELRLSDGPRARAGVVFDYQDTENHARVQVNWPNTLQLVYRAAGTDTVVAEHQIDITAGRWLELKLLFNGQELVVEFDEHRRVLTEAQAMRSGPILGLYVPEQSRVEFRSIVIEGEPRTPRTSIVASQTFEHGASTQDLLSISERPFSGGAGISFSERTPAWESPEGHGEWEFPIVIRRFSDNAVVNETGDRFDYRLVDDSETVVPAASVASVTLDVPDGHLGGTFVETPMRIGPWQAVDGSLYFLMEPAETWNALMVVKSRDGGKSWLEMDGARRPQTGDLEGFGSVLVGDRIHMLHQTSDDVWYHVFNTASYAQAPDTWAIRDERVASPPEPPTQVADIAVRSDASVVAVYGGSDKIRLRIRSPEGQWGQEQVLDAASSPGLSGPTMVLGRDDEVHLAYTDSEGIAWYRKILPDNAVSDRVRVSSELGTADEDVGAILPLLYLHESDSLSVLYRRRDGRLYERRVDADGQWSDPVRVSDRIVVQNSVDSEQAGADAVVDGRAVHVLFIEEGSGKLIHAVRQEETWSERGVLVDDEEVQWVRGAIVTRPDGQRAYAYVYDAGADGGSGKNRYGEILIQDL